MALKTRSEMEATKNEEAAPEEVTVKDANSPVAMAMKADTTTSVGLRDNIIVAAAPPSAPRDRATPEPPTAAGGEYVVIHGKITFGHEGEQAIEAHVGSRVRLNAEEATRMLADKMVRPATP